ncbi:CHAT domain-containing protein [Antrihabitans stalactiti]|uniref:CHAT domain-containing protein n=1 Tax=Antrihabitans stalactiti TaxID=2584121 RepID=A0A848KQE4_9NOCA|nr:CHAT domain-containing protein [Antrihabitans stalactiti]NMN99144.1 CHAT domain-containing protein [Antrihabitans stalactiti]
MVTPDLPSRPTVVVRMADAGNTYLYWHWPEGVGAPGVSVVPYADVTEALDRLAAALPNLADPFGLERCLTTGTFASYDAENALAERLSQLFLPYNLAFQLDYLYNRGIKPHIRIQPSPRVAQIPWELISPDPGLRLVDIADVSVLAPVGVVHAPGRTARHWEDTKHLPVVNVLDPRIPGFPADSTLGSVLGRMTADAPAARMVAARTAERRMRPKVSDPVAAFRRSDVDRAWLSDELRSGASRLVYVGHVTAAPPESGQSENAELHLACGAAVPGFAPPQRTHRPFSAKDLILGTHTLTDEPAAGPDLWPMPSRVALIACESGGDLRFGDAFGLVTAMIHSGVELITASRWALPTDFAFHRIAGAAPGARPLQDAVYAIDAAHEQPDPVSALASWQRERLDAWREERSMEHSPVLWAAFATIDTVTQPHHAFDQK